MTDEGEIVSRQTCHQGDTYAVASAATSRFLWYRVVGRAKRRRDRKVLERKKLPFSDLPILALHLLHSTFTSFIHSLHFDCKAIVENTQRAIGYDEFLRTVATPLSRPATAAPSFAKMVFHVQLPSASIMLRSA